MITKLCIFTSSFSPNKQAMLDYFETIFPKSTEIYLFTPKNHKHLYNLKRTNIADTKCSKITSPFELRRFCKKNKIQRLISIGQLPYEAFVMAYASWFTPTDFITYHLGNPIDSLRLNSFKTRIRTSIEAIISYFFTIFPKKIIFVSENQAKRAKKYLLTKRKIFYLYPAIPTSLFKPKDKIQSRKKLNLGPYDKIIIFIGRIGYLKGSDILVSIIKRNPDKKLILIGEIVDKNLKENLKKSNFQNLTYIPSKTHEELVDYYSASDLCFFPSRIEGTPLVPREAMSCGTPVIITKMPSTESIKEAAIRIPLDSDKMNQAINNFFNLPPKKIKQLSQKSRNLIIQKFDNEKWRNEYIERILN